MTNHTSGPGSPRAPRVRLTDAEWQGVLGRRAAEEERLRRYDGALLVDVEGDRRLYDAGEPIRLRPHRAGAAVTVTDGDGTPLAGFSLPEADEGDVQVEYPGPPEMALTSGGGTAVVQRVVETADLSLFDDANWSRSHWIVAAILAVSWMAVGAQVTFVESLRDVLGASSHTWAVAAYLMGTVPGAFLFGRLADRVGRRPMHFVTASVCVAATTATLAYWYWTHDPGSPAPSHGYAFLAFRFLVGVAVGGEYVALGTTVQELMPRHVRGRACLAINGAFWLGLAAVVGLAPSTAGAGPGWGAVLLVGGSGALLLGLRWLLPESPRWLVAHYRKDRRTERMLEEIRRDAAGRPGRARTPAAPPVRLLVPAFVPVRSLARVLWRDYRRQALVCLALVCSQALFYNVFFFDFRGVLGRFVAGAGTEAVPAPALLVVAAANFAGPVLLGWCFDRFGRKPAISVAYATSGGMLLAIAGLVSLGWEPVGAWGMVIALALVFFFASAAASSAYLTMGESFPVEVRAFAFSLLLGAAMLCGALGVALHGLIDHVVFAASAAALMVAAAAAQWFFGTEFTDLPLEERAPPLSLARSQHSGTAAA